MNTRETPSHHYVLAHVALRKVCRQNPVKFFGIMASPHRDAFFQDLWRQVRLNCDKDGTPPFDILDLKVGTFRIRDFPCIIVVMPPPANIGEAHFVGIILKSEPNATPEDFACALEDRL